MSASTASPCGASCQPPGQLTALTGVYGVLPRPRLDPTPPPPPSPSETHGASGTGQARARRVSRSCGAAVTVPSTELPLCLSSERGPRRRPRSLASGRSSPPIAGCHRTRAAGSGRCDAPAGSLLQHSRPSAAPESFVAAQSSRRCAAHTCNPRTHSAQISSLLRRS